MKIRVFDSDGVYRGGLFKTDCFNGMTCRMWHAPPHPDYREALIDIAGKDSPCREQSWFRLQFARVQDISGPSDGSDDFDANSTAYRITPTEAAMWLDRHGYYRPPDLIALMVQLGQQSGGATSNAAAAPLPDAAKEVWDALAGKVLSAKQLARALRSNEDAIRKRIAVLKRAGCAVANRRGAGYYREDAPPPGLPVPTGDQRESG